MFALVTLFSGVVVVPAVVVDVACCCCVGVQQHYQIG